MREAYEDSLRREGHERDSAQEEIVALLDDLQTRLRSSHAPRHAAWRFWKRRRDVEYRAERGLYIWGGVGRGKTFLMDLFFETLQVHSKRRVHFHRIMREVHERLKALQDIPDPIDVVATDVARDARVLCFDEFYVSDIGDAMLLGRLLDGLFRRGVTLVTTSNTAPDELYKDGLQRQRFIPAIELLKTHTRVVQIDGDVDYRLRLLEKAGTFLTPDDDRALDKLEHLFANAASMRIATDRMLEINGRDIRARKCAKGIAWFDFAELCDGPRSQLDYMEIARWYPTVIVSGVPAFDGSLDDKARRFVALVDEFYDRRVKLIVAARTDVGSLYTGRRLAFEFERTKSRLIEMQSTSYLAAAHRA